MKKNLLILSSIFLFLIGLVFVHGQPLQPVMNSNGQAQSCMMCTIAGAILDELKIFNDNKPGEMVTGYAVLKDGSIPTNPNGFWLPMPVGTCEVTIFSQAPGMHIILSTEARDVYTTRNQQICNNVGSVDWSSCTHTMTFDEDFHFYHPLDGASTQGASYFSVAYKCTLT